MPMTVVEGIKLGLVPIVTNVVEIQRYCVDDKNSIIYQGFKKKLKKVIKSNKSKIDFQEMSNNINIFKNKRLYKEDIFSNCKLISQSENYLS